jgi:hypothetical protein
MKKLLIHPILYHFPLGGALNLFLGSKKATDLTFSSFQGTFIDQNNLRPESKQVSEINVFYINRGIAMGILLKHQTAPREARRLDLHEKTPKCRGPAVCRPHI